MLAEYVERMCSMEEACKMRQPSRRRAGRPRSRRSPSGDGVVRGENCRARRRQSDRPAAVGQPATGARQLEPAEALSAVWPRRRIAQKTAKLLGVLAALLALAGASRTLGSGTAASALGARTASALGARALTLTLTLTLTRLAGIPALCGTGALTRAPLILLALRPRLTLLALALAAFVALVALTLATLTTLTALTTLATAIVSIRHEKPPLEELLFRGDTFSKSVPARTYEEERRELDVEPFDSLSFFSSRRRRATGCAPA